MNSPLVVNKFFLVVAIAIFTFGFTPTIYAAQQTRIDFLLRFFDLNERAFAYHRHCLSRAERINPKFLKTFEFVADELFEEAQKNEPNTKPEYIKTKIIERRYNIQYGLDHAHIQHGCHTQDIEIAKAHYEEFSRYNIQEIRDFIDKEANN